MSEPTEGLASSGPAQDAIPDPVDERAPFEPDGNVATIIFSRIADVQTRGALAMASRSWRDASRLLASLPKAGSIWMVCQRRRSTTLWTSTD